MPKKQTRYTVAFKRRREGKTDYKKRRLLLSSRKPRLIVRKSNKQLCLQLATFAPEGDKIVTTLHSKALRKYGWKASLNSTPAAYLSGLLFGKKAIKHAKEVILDNGLHVAVKGSRIFAATKGAIDAGLTIPCGKSMVPAEERIKGSHISDEVVKEFETVKKKILESD